MKHKLVMSYTTTANTPGDHSPLGSTAPTHLLASYIKHLLVGPVKLQKGGITKVKGGEKGKRDVRC